jgi:hypothetical protein
VGFANQFQNAALRRQDNPGYGRRDYLVAERTQT